MKWRVDLLAARAARASAESSLYIVINDGGFCSVDLLKRRR